MSNHRFKHLGCRDDRQTNIVALANNALLNQGHFLWCHLHPEVASRYHHAVHRSEYLVEMREGFWFLQLGNKG